METLPVIAARQLAIGYSHGKNGSTVVHRDLSFDLWAGELTCLLGPNGPPPLPLPPSPSDPFHRR